MSVTFATTGRFSWLIIAKRVIADPTRIVVHDDGPKLISVLQAIGLDPAFCRVKFVAKSSAAVYSVSVVDQFVSSQGQSCYAIPADEPVLAIKVVPDPALLETEIKALASLQTVATPERPLYALGYVQFGQPVVWFDKVSPKIGRAIGQDKPEEAWWHWGIKHEELKGGCILMHPASKCQQNMRIMSVKNKASCGVMTSLRLAHSVQWCHCDVRESNVLEFPQPIGW